MYNIYMTSIAAEPEIKESPQEKAMKERRGRRRAKSRGSRSWKGHIESCTGPQVYKDSPQYQLAQKANENRENPLHKMLTTVGPGYEITRYLNANTLLDVKLLTSKTEVALSDSMSFDVENDVKFKREWEKNELDDYFYSVPMKTTIDGKAEWVLYKILKGDEDKGSYKERARHVQHGGPQFRQIGCLNWITFGGKIFRIYDFPYKAPGLEEPVEFFNSDGREDREWKNVIRRRYRCEGTEWDQALDAWPQAMQEEGGKLWNKIMEGKRNYEQIEQRYLPYFDEGNEISEEDFVKIYENEILSEYYLHQQKKWMKEVFLGEKMPGNTIKHVELKSTTRQVMDMIKDSYECCSNACEKLKEGVQGCAIMGGRRKRTRRRRKKNHKKRTKKKARRKRRRKSSKRRRRRKR